MRTDPYHPTSGRADYSDATTVSLIYELADILAKAEQWDAAIFRRLKPEQHAEYEALINVDYSLDKLRKYAADWQERLDAEVVR
jgi:hypothetical protein